MSTATNTRTCPALRKISPFKLLFCLALSLCGFSALAQAPDFLFEVSYGSSATGATGYALRSSWGESYTANPISGLFQSGALSGSTSSSSVTMSSNIQQTGSRGSGVTNGYQIFNLVKVYSRGPATVSLSTSTSGNASFDGPNNAGYGVVSYLGIPFFVQGQGLSSIAAVLNGTSGSVSNSTISPTNASTFQGTLTCGNNFPKTFAEYPGVNYYLVWSSGNVQSTLTSGSGFRGTLTANGTTTVSGTRGTSTPTVAIGGPIVSGTPVANLQRSVSHQFRDESIDPDGGAAYQTADICNRAWTITKPTGSPLTGTASTLSFTPTIPGPYTVSLTVTDNEGASASTSRDFIVGGPRSCAPGAPTIRPRGCSDDKTDFQVEPFCGEVSVTSKDPTATRGYPLRNEITVLSQNSAPPVMQPMGNAYFTYGLQIVSLSNSGGGSVSDPRRYLVDGIGHAYDYGLASSGSDPKTPGVYPTLTVDGSGYTLSGAGAPHSIYEAGNFTYQFSTSGALLSITDPNGNVQTVSYTSGRPTLVTDGSSGKTITFEYDASDRINKVVENGSFASRSIGYDSSNRVTSIITKDGSSVTVRSLEFTYDGNGRVSTVKRDGDAATTATLSYVYGGAGRYLANVAYGSGSTNLEYFAIPASSAVAYRTEASNYKSGVTIYDYDSNGNLVALYEPTYNFGTTASTSVNHTYTYDNNRNVLTHSVGNTSETYTYNSKGKVTRVIDAGSRYTDYTYASNGVDLTSVADNQGTIAQFQYTNTGLPHAVTAFLDSVGASWSFTRNAFGQVTSITPPTGSPTGAWSFTYDETTSSPTYGWLKTVTNGAGNVATVNSYTSLGDPTSVTTNPSGGVSRTVQVAYDATQRETVFTHDDGKTVQTAYTGANPTAVTDEAGTLYQYSYCAECGKLTGASGPLSWSLSWLLDSDRDVSKFTDALAQESTYAYGRARELSQETEPDGKYVQYRYDNVARKNWERTRRNTIRTTSYDTSSNVTNDGIYAYTYDTAGRMLTASGASSTVTYTYGSNRLVDTVTYTFSGTGAPANQILVYTYNPDQTVATLTWRDGNTNPNVLPVIQWTYGYDGAGRLQSVANNFGETTTFTYDGEGKLLSQTNQNGTVREYAYNNSRSWPLFISHKLSGTMLASYGLTYDSSANTVGNLTSVSESGSWVGTSSSTSYGYDALYRLTSEARSGGSSAYSSSFGYDLAGNPTTVDGSTFGAFNNANKFTSVLGKTVTHDGDGNITAIATSPFTFSSGTWSVDNKLTRFTRVNGSYVDYRYLFDGKRYYSKDSVSGSPAKYYIFAGDLLIGEINDTTPTVAYTWGADGLISERLLTLDTSGGGGGGEMEIVIGPIDDGTGDVLQATTSLRCDLSHCEGDVGTSLWYHFGPQGETRYTTDKYGTLVDSYLYSSYGKPISSTENRFNQFRYGGKYGYYTEVSTQFVLATQRWYSPNLQRWVSRDPIGLEGGVNLYEYVASSPVRWVDPEGLLPLKLPDNPSQLPPGWIQIPHGGPERDGGTRWRPSDGKDGLEFHPGRPGAPGNRGRDHWHIIRPRPRVPGKYDKDPRHRKPGEVVNIECRGDLGFLDRTLGDVSENLSALDTALDRIVNDIFNPNRGRKGDRHLPILPPFPIFLPVP